MNLVRGPSLESLYPNIVKHLVLEQLLGREPELLVELEHGLQHFDDLGGALREAPAQGVALPLRAHLLRVLNSSFV